MTELIPIDHDPFAGNAAGPELEPVDGNPFEEADPTLEAVDGNPFAETSGARSEDFPNLATDVNQPPATATGDVDVTTLQTVADNPVPTRRQQVRDLSKQFSSGVIDGPTFVSELGTLYNGPKAEPPAPQEDSLGTVISKSAEAGVERFGAQVGGIRQRVGESLFQSTLELNPELAGQLTRQVQLTIDEIAKLPKGDGMELPSPETLSKARAEKARKAIQGVQAELPEVKAGREQYQRHAEAATAARPKVEDGSFKYYLGAATETMIGNVAPMMAVALITRSPNMALGMMGGQVYGEKYAEQRKKGRTEDESNIDALFYAASEAITEKIPLAIVLKRGTPFLKKVLQGTVAEGAQEVFNEALQMGYEAQVLDEKVDLKTALRRLLDAGIIGGMLGGGMGAVAAPFTGKDSETDNPTPVPEPKETVQAQLDALRDGRKPAVLITPGEALPKLPEGAKTLSLGDKGTLVYKDPKILEAIRDGRLGEALGYGIDRKPQGSDTVVTARDSQGRVIQDVVSDGRPEIDKAAQRVAGEAGSVETRPAADAVQERLQRTQAETAYPVEQISERSIIVLGKPNTIRETLKANGIKYRGSYNEKRGGLVFPVKHTEKIRAALQKRTQEKPERPLSEVEHDAATSPKNDLPQPTPAQQEAGNYKKAHIRLNGLDISIENPKGSQRTGVDRDGKKWSVTMQHSYGYLKGTVGKDKDHLDISLGPEAENPKRPVFIVDQIDPKTGRFDEHKIQLGFRNSAAARTGYLANYEKGWKGLGGIKHFTQDGFKQWLKGDTTKPVTAKVRNQKATKDKQPVSGASARSAVHPGEAYTGFINDAATPRKATESKPIRREDVLAPFLKALNVPLYQGRVKGKGRLGFYLPKKEAVRVKRLADLETTAHELAHLLDDRIPEIRKQWSPANKANQAVRKELRSVSYDAGKLYEGFAEFVRLYMTQNAKAKEAAPNFYKWFEQFTQRHEYGPAIEKARDDMHGWFEQDALNRAQSKIGQTRNMNESLDSVFSRFRQSVADDLEGVYRMERELTGKTSPVGAYETARLTRGVHAMVEGALTIGRPVVKEDGSFTFEGKGLQQILDPVSKDIDNWTLYAVGRSAKELMQQGREKLFTRAEIESMVDLETPAFRKAFDEYQAFNKGILDFAQSLGLINVDSRKMWQRTQYLPFHRVNQPGAGNKGGVQGNWDGIKALTGGTANLSDVLGNMIQNVATLITAAVKNEARIKIADMADKQRGGGRFMVRIPKEERKIKLNKDQIRDATYRALGIKAADVRTGQVPESLQGAIAMMERAFAKQPALMDFWMPGQAPFGDNVVAVLRNGKPDYYEVSDPLLYRALSSLTRPGKHWLTRALNQVRRVGQATVTLTPDFMAANIARDTIMGGVISRHGFKPFIDSIKGMQSRLKKDATYREFIANGGGFSSYLVDESAFRKHLERFYTKKGINYQAVIDTPAKALYALETIADAFEMSTRLGEFKRAKKAGEHPRHAAYSAREVSTDFAMRGDSQTLGFLYDSVMFLKAGVNGLDRYYRGVAHDPNKAAVATKTGLLALISMGLYALNRDNPLYEDLEDWNKDTHWHFFIPKPGTDENTPAKERYHHFMYPKIWEVGAVASIAERTMEQIMDEKVNGERFAKDFARITLNMFKLDVMPQAIKPLAEQAMNKNLFTERPIENQTMQGLAPFARSGPYTSKALTELGMATRNFPAELQFRPARAEALLRGYFNTWATYGMMMADAMVSDDKPDMRIDQYPVLKRFYAQEPAKHTKYSTRFYGMLKRATELRRTLREMDRRYRPDIADELETKPEITDYKQLTRANKELQGINREIRATYRGSLDQVQGQMLERHRKKPESLDHLRQDGTWNDTGALKRLLIDELIRERNDLLKAVVEDVESGGRSGH